MAWESISRRPRRARRREHAEAVSCWHPLEFSRKSFHVYPPFESGEIHRNYAFMSSTVDAVRPGIPQPTTNFIRVELRASTLEDVVAEMGTGIGNPQAFCQEVMQCRTFIF